MKTVFSAHSKRLLGIFLAVIMILSVIPIGIIGFAETEGNFTYSVNNGAIPLVIVIIPVTAFTHGDVDNEGKITAADARLALRASVGLEKYTAGTVQYNACDVDNDGKITAADARLILRTSVGLETLQHTFGNWVAEDTESEFTTGRHYRTCSCGEKEYANCEYGTPTEKSAATCTSSNIMQKVCKYCGTVKTYGGDKPATGHTNTLKKTTSPTCESKGSNVYECTVCGNITVTDIQALGHDIVSHEAKPASCTEIGWEAYDTCSRCDYTTYEEIKALGHDTVSHEAKPASCTEIGWNAYETCSRCDYTTYAEISALGHDIVKHEAKAATCTEIGWEAYDTCSRCDYTTYEEIKALGHDIEKHEAKVATCTEIGWESYDTCSRCYYTTYAEISALGHDIVKHEAKVATCTEIGWEAYDTCSRCDYTTYAEISALGHNFTSTDVKDETTFSKSATCTTDTEYYYTCSNANCGKSAKGIDETKTYVDTGSKLGHDYTVKNCVFGDNARGLICNRCNYIDNSAEGYNQLVNAIKEKSFMNLIDEDTPKLIHSVSVISKSRMTSTCDNIDFGLLWTSAVKNLYAEEMNGDDISYLICRRNGYIGTIVPYSNTKTTADTPVSSIEEGDATITVEKVSGLAANALLSDFGNMDDNGNCTNTITVGTTDYNIADFKTKAISGDLIKITAVAKKETFFGTNGVSKLDSSTKTALQKLTGYNIRLDADEFGDNYTLTQIDEEEEEDIYKMQMDMKLKDITSTATVVFYFDAETLNPVAARYDVNVIMAQDVAMSIEIFGSNALSVSGKLAPVIKTETSTVYLFSDFYGYIDNEESYLDTDLTNEKNAPCYAIPQTVYTYWENLVLFFHKLFGL